MQTFLAIYLPLILTAVAGLLVWAFDRNEKAHAKLNQILADIRRNVSKEHEVLGAKIDNLHQEIKEFWRDKAKE